MVVSGEGIIGFTRAFTYAGAQSIIVSLWKVNDDTTKTLMTQFYKNIFTEKGSPMALQKAQLKLVRNKTHQLPYYWSAFIIYGD